MSKNLKVKINPEGIAELFKSDEMQAYLDEVGEAVVNAAEATGKGKYSKRTQRQEIRSYYRRIYDKYRHQNI